MGRREEWRRKAIYSKICMELCRRARVHGMVMKYHFLPIATWVLLLSPMALWNVVDLSNVQLGYLARRECMNEFVFCKG